jgi:uncharacterized protein
MNLSPDYETNSDSSAPAAPTSTGVEPFVPRRGLRGAHMQTLASHVLPRRNLLPPPAQQTFQIEEGVQVLCLCHWQASGAGLPTLVILHGLEGSSDSQYVIGTANKAWNAGMNVVRMNVRNCGGTEALCRTLYNSGLSGDIDIVVRELIHDKGLNAVLLAGFSMGGNQVLKLAGEWGSNAPPQVRAAAAVSPAMDLSLSADALHLPSNRIYEWRFLWSLRQRLRRKLRIFPDSLQVKQWWWRSIRDFDDIVTAPHCGYRDAEDYYERASAARVIDRISIPALILHSKDDPFIRVSQETRAKILANPCISFVETEHGGHCAFLASPDGYDGRWAERQILNFLREHALQRE